MSYDNGCTVTCMDDASQDAIVAIERALVSLRFSRIGPAAGAAGAGAPWPGSGPPSSGAGPREHPGHDHGHLAGAARIRLLAALREQDGQSVSDLAEAIGVDQPRASRLVNDSVERGLVTRRADHRDARRSVVHLSAEGRLLLETGEARRRRAVADAVAGFTQQEAAALAELLTRFSAAFAQRRAGDEA